MDKPGLQFFFCLQLVVSHTFLAVGTFFPVCLFHFIAADVHIFIREQVNQFAIYVFTKLYCGLFSGANGRRECASPTYFVGTGYSGIIADGCQHVTRHVNFGNNVDAAYFGIFYHFFYILLCIISAIQRVTFHDAKLVYRNPVIGVIFRFSQFHA